MLGSRLFTACSIFLLSLSLQTQYAVTGSIPLPGVTGWDYAYADSGARMLYVTHGNVVHILDLDTQKPVADITGLNRIHGVAIANDLNHGFISDGGDNVVVMFDVKTHAVLQKIPAGKNPDGIVYDPFSKRVFAFNGRSQDVTAIDAASGTVAGTVALGGKPEFPVSDGKGGLWANVEDKNEIVHLDPKGLTVLHHWAIAPCEGPSGLAFDPAGRRLFAVCDEKKMVAVDADSGKVVATVPIGDGPDAAGYDAEKKLVFSSNGEGTLTVVKQESPDKYSVLQTVTTEKSARTMALDTKTHKIYLPAAKLGPRPPATQDNPHPWPKIEPDSFHLVVVSPQ
jgi:YVTN family beta-propeller protein